MSRQLPPEINPIVEKIIDRGFINTEERNYFKVLITKYFDILEPDLTNLFDKIINYNKPILPYEYRDKLLLYISGIM